MMNKMEQYKEEEEDEEEEEEEMMFREREKKMEGYLESKSRMSRLFESVLKVKESTQISLLKVNQDYSQDLVFSDDEEEEKIENENHFFEGKEEEMEGKLGDSFDFEEEISKTNRREEEGKQNSSMQRKEEMELKAKRETMNQFNEFMKSEERMQRMKQQQQLMKGSLNFEGLENTSLEYKIDLNGEDNGLMVGDLSIGNSSSYYRYKVSEYSTFQKYVFDSFKDLDLIQNLDLVVSIVCMFVGMKSKHEKTTNDQLSDLHLSQLGEFLNHIELALESFTLNNSRYSFFSSNNSPSNSIQTYFNSPSNQNTIASSLLSSFEASLMPEIAALEYSCLQNQSKIDCYEERGMSITFVKLLHRIKKRLKWALEQSILEQKNYEALVNYAQLVGWRIAYFSIGNTETILEKREKTFLITIEQLHQSGPDEYKFATSLMDIIEKTNSFLTVVNGGTEASKSLFSSILDIGDDKFSPPELATILPNNTRDIHNGIYNRTKFKPSSFPKRTEPMGNAMSREFLKARLRLEQIETANLKLHEEIKQQTMKAVLSRGSSFTKWLQDQVKNSQPPKQKNFLKQLVFTITQEDQSALNCNFKNDFRFIQLKKHIEQCRIALEKSKSGS
eukprot:TRINITY_DN2198_c0_g1_i2.p1 TRINITY_DN2198_c0_g1~~TRINITY_DN2198_c0_g1_i2.p1  ORF type:complete len:617 (-),score=205.09 TRINITY_DN2198_c0_g1_i2:24-1874(-)